MGLPITRRLVSLMGGSIEITSEVEKGSTFHIVIPGVPYMDQFGEKIIQKTIDPSQIVFDRATLLVVDDVELNREYIKDALTDSGLIVYEAGNGLEAYKMALKNKPDLIITDIRMPVMSGFELLEKLQKDKALKHIPVIAYSASLMQDQKDKIQESRFASLLMKPTTVYDLYYELSKLLPFKTSDVGQAAVTEGSDSKNMEVINKAELLALLENKFRETWTTFSEVQPINEIKTFGKDLIDLGDKHQSILITEYGNKLINSANSFDVDGLLRLIRSYPEVVNNVMNTEYGE